jgi:hypothetical protein
MAGTPHAQLINTTNNIYHSGYAHKHEKEAISGSGITTQGPYYSIPTSTT